MRRSIATDGGRYAVVELGRPSRREPLVFLHGFTGDQETWRTLAQELAPPWQCILIELPGHGGTIAGPTPEHFSIEATSAALDQILAAMGIERASVVGYSMGGRIALHFALTSSRVSRLVLESASAGIEDPVDRTARRDADETLARDLEEAGIEPFVAHWEGLPLFASHTPQLRCELRAQRLRCDPTGLAASLRGVGTGSQAYLGERIRELEMPILFVVGALDAKFKRIAQTLAARCQHATVATLEGAGHLAHREQPEAFRSVLQRFLGEPE